MTQVMWAGLVILCTSGLMWATVRRGRDFGKFTSTLIQTQETQVKLLAALRDEKDARQQARLAAMPEHYSPEIEDIINRITSNRRPA